MPTSLRALLSQRASATPHAIAITADDTSITWSALQGRARRVAAALVRDGIGVQARVAYLGKNDPRWRTCAPAALGGLPVFVGRGSRGLDPIGRGCRRRGHGRNLDPLGAELRRILEP
jgi:non-ribosomal peptide synthetase component E (peptide arylation enzyme)